jgi:hypothetical protein
VQVLADAVGGHLGDQFRRPGDVFPAVP